MLVYHDSLQPVDWLEQLILLLFNPLTQIELCSEVSLFVIFARAGDADRASCEIQAILTTLHAT